MAVAEIKVHVSLKRKQMADTVQFYFPSNLFFIQWDKIILFNHRRRFYRKQILSLFRLKILEDCSLNTKWSNNRVYIEYV
jgi:hypothetical protein